MFITFSCYTSATRVMWEFNRIYRNLESALTDAAQFTELLLEPLVVADPEAPQPFRPRDSSVELRDVAFRYTPAQPWLFARAILKDAPILVLDEATSALDSESEALIQEALWTLMAARTAIVIAHRLSTVRRMDRLVVLDQGRIIEQGSHEALLGQHGVYAAL